MHMLPLVLKLASPGSPILGFDRSALGYSHSFMSLNIHTFYMYR